MANHAFEIVMAVIGALLTIAGYSVSQTLLDIKTSMREISHELKETAIDLASFTSETKTTLVQHSKRLDNHDDAFKKMYQ